MDFFEKPVVLSLLAAFALIGGIIAFVSYTEIAAKGALRADLAALDPLAEPSATVAAAVRYLLAPAANIDPGAAAWALAQYEKALRRKMMLNAGRDDTTNEADLAAYRALHQTVVTQIEEARQ